MKHLYTYIYVLACAMLAGSANAQIVEVRDIDGNLLNGGMVQVSEPVGGDDQIMGIAAAVENVSGIARTVNVKRYEMNVPHGTGNYFCWDVCYGERNAGVSQVWVGADPVSMAAGFTANGFHAYYKPHTIIGEATFRYVWYDLANPNDSVWVDIQFNAMVLGIAENNSPVRAFTAFPNPSVRGDLTLNYDLASLSDGMQLAFYNMLGERKLVRAIGAAQGKVVIRDGDLSSGVWFAVLERNGKPLATKRVVVVR